MRFVVQYETPFHLWKHYGTYGGRNTAYRTAQTKAQQQRRRFRIVDDNNNLLDIINP